MRQDNVAPAGSPGSLYIGDVGWQRYEELNVANKPGMNFGWPCFQVSIHPSLSLYIAIQQESFLPRNRILLALSLSYLL